MDVGRSQQRTFETTRWSIVVQAGEDSSEDARAALAKLCESYWVPLYGYVRRRISNVAEAHDLTQAFFAELLEKNYVAAADPERGRFRTFLLTSLRNFLSKQWDKQKALKRGGGQSLVSLDFAKVDSSFRIEPESRQTPEQIFEREWTLTLLSQILDRLRTEFEGRGQSTEFEHLKPHLIGNCDGVSWAETATKMNTTEAAAKMAGSRLRARYRDLLRSEIAETVSNADDVDDEIQKLFQTLGAG